MFVKRSLIHLFMFQNFDWDSLTNALIKGASKKIIDLQRSFVTTVVKFQPGQLGVVTNGRVFGPLDSDETFVVDDFSLLDRFCYNSYGERILQVFKREKSNSVLAEGNSF